ncbi:hypothetical protein [Hymenobacter chitinivorans]|uniref:Uncharacterized protein n=1 Tax=Hymenobacter chitinivorans DSM 11115 TaxID=1121954 RepID=A0A2M9B5I0_9BACT|nr:hypothetical protein [Hymenobacter chitinivorans]PJJ53203.1 hypothetical protein CLV45_3862 [Hymenobacter chitinivorans DSM 11115]
MPKGNNFPAVLADAELTGARAAIKALQGKLAFVPQQPESLLTSATISAERLPLADLALQAAEQAPDIMRKAADPELLRSKIEQFRALTALRNQLAPELTRLDNAVNVLGSDILFHVNNVHADIESDKGENVDLGELRQDINAYYARPAARKSNKKNPV